MEVGRLLTAMATPFDEDMEVDYQRAAALARRLIDSGSDGLVVAGTTGESPTLRRDEKIKLFRTVLEAVGERAAVWAATGTNDTAATVELTQEVEDIGVHGVMVVVPYYNRPSQDGLYRHFRRIADATSLPVMLYNIPSRTGQNMQPQTIVRVARDCPNLVAVKEASGNIDQAVAIIRAARRQVRVLSGEDKLTLPLLAVGGHGIVSVAAHLVGPAIRRMIEAHIDGRADEAAALHRRLWPLFCGLFISANPGPLKWAMQRAGFGLGGVREPLAPLQEAEEQTLAEVLRELRLV